MLKLGLCRCAMLLLLSPFLFSQSAAPALPPDIPAWAELYSLINGGNLAGQQAVWTTPDGTLHLFFQFNDRGRGPKITSLLKLDGKSIPVSTTNTGNDYLKSPVNESFTLASGTARWKNEAEHGEKNVSAPAFYSSLNGAPGETALLIHAALQNGGKIALLPEGEARVERRAELDVEAGGHKTHAVLYTVTGLDFAPTYVWLHDLGCPTCRFFTKDQFFASVEDGGSIILQGWESTAQAMLDAQSKIKDARAAELAVKLAHGRGNILFENANLFDADSGKIIPNQNVWIRANLITKVEPSEPGSPRAYSIDSPRLIDATGKTLLPGLWDMHAHVGDNDGLLNLAAGVTSVRDLANDTDSLLARRKRIDEGKEIGTRIVLAGIIDGNDAFHGPTKVLVTTEAEARAAVDNYKKLGYVQIKIYSSLPPALVPVIIDEAHKNGMRVSGHIPAGMTAAQCVALGYDEIQHINFLVLNFFPEVKDTNTITRLTKPGEVAASLDFNSDQVKAFIKLLQNHHTRLDLTLSIFEDQYMAKPGEIPPGFRPVANRLPAQVRRGLLTQGMTPPASLPEGAYKKSFARMLEYTGLLYRSGLSIEAGTDSMAGFALHRELELEVQAGIPPAQVLQNATLNAAKIMGLDDDLGSIKEGKLADLVLVDGDPTRDISAVRKTALVVKDGVLYKPAELYTELGIVP